MNIVSVVFLMLFYGRMLQLATHCHLQLSPPPIQLHAGTYLASNVHGRIFNEQNLTENKSPSCYAVNHCAGHRLRLHWFNQDCLFYITRSQVAYVIYMIRYIVKSAILKK